MANWLSPNDLKNAAENLGKRLEENSQQKGKEAADRLMEATRNYGGLWFLIRLPASLVAGGISLALIFTIAGIDSKLVSAIAMVVGTYFWYVGRPLKVHPIWELVLVYFGFIVLSKLMYSFGLA